MAPKPRGLKASKKAAPAFDPAAAAAAADSTATSGERTMPLDQDHLSVADLFELRISAVALLETGDAEKQEEARGLLRGILHGAEDLLPLLPDEDDDEEEEEEKDEEEKKKFKALGLDDDFARSFLRYLQGFALHELASILPPAEPLAPSALSAAQGSKKRKIDLTEPTDPAVWLDEAIEKYEAALEPINEEEGNLWTMMVIGGLVRSTAERGALAVRRGDTKEAERRLFGSGHYTYLDGTMLDIIGNYGGFNPFSRAEFIEEQGDPVSPWIAGVGALIALAESAEELNVSRRREIVRSVNETLQDQQEALTRELKRQEDEEDVKKLSSKWKFDLAVVVADGLLAEFVFQEDAVEAKYRPDAEDVGDDDEEGEVTPLPTDAKEVQSARKAALRAIDALRDSIKLCEELSDAEQVKTLKLAQYKKLEEAYLLYSALFNSDVVEGTKTVEDALEQVRKDGGLDTEETAEETKE